jgi:TfoX/Sxy family transcriptional regulator of competence genes
MAWVKIPKENHPLFHACLPRDRRVSTVNMFGGVAAKVHGRMFAALFGRGAMVKLSAADREAALALDGAEPFDPMKKGRAMRDSVLLPESVLDEPEELREWFRKALDYTASLPARGDAREVTPARPRAKPAASGRAKPTGRPKVTATKRPRARR